MPSRGSRTGWAVLAWGLVLGCRGPGCGDAPTEPTPAAQPKLEAVEPSLADQLFVSPDARDFSNNPKLLQRILGTAHGYFRFINVAFSQAVCRKLHQKGYTPPAVNLHGDAHLEQYAVTDLGRGLTDFDDSSKGPAIIDLLRFATSLKLALRDAKTDPDEAIERFLAGYRAALENPEIAAPEPSWAAGVRAKFTRDRKKYFSWIESIMAPVDDAREKQVEVALADYVQAMHIRYPDLRAGFFDLVDIGRLHMGIGSALDEKYLVRVAGLTDDPLDDVVLEVKEVRSLAGIDCIEGAKSSDPFRILLAQSRIAYEPYAYLGYIDLEGRKFWIHSWVDNYRELSVGTLADQPEALFEVVYDVGVQLGRGHPKIAGEFGIQLRQSQSRFLERYGDEFRAGVDKLAEATVEAWQRFRAEHARDEEN